MPVAHRLAPGLSLLAGAAALGGFALGLGQEARRAERRYPAPGRFLTIRGIRLHLLEPQAEGEAPPVVLLHGNGAMVEDFATSGLMELLTARHRRVVAIDRPGFGHSTRPRRRAWTPAAQASLVAEAIHRLGLDRPVVLGHSWGAMVALALALDHPEALRGLVLMGGFHTPTARWEVPAFSGPAVPVLGDVMRYTISPPLGRLILPGLLRRIFGPMPVPARFLRGFPLPLVLHPRRLRAAAEETAMMIPAAAALRRRWGELRLPVAILAGSEDRIVDPMTHARALAAALPQAVLRIHPGAGHMLHHAAPELVASAIGAVAMAESRTQPVPA
jgi:pimeloyl-ACP methyl ester carboxylesterase